MVILLCGASILHHTGGLHKVWDGLALKDVGVLRLAASDYAGNVTGFTIDLGGLDRVPGSLTPCPMALFGDVSQRAWYHEAVDHALRRRTMETTKPGEFDPAGIATRAQVVSALYAMSGSGEVIGDTSFGDVPLSMKGVEAIRWAAESGIADGYAEGVFLPFAPVSRQQLAVFLYRFAGVMERDTTARAELTSIDRSRVSLWAEEAMMWAVGEGIFTVNRDGRLDPQGNVTRAELAQVLLRFEKKTEKAA